MSKVADEKKARQGISIPPDLLASAKERAKNNLSAYVRGLIKKDLAGEEDADALSTTVVVDLTRRLCGEIDATEMSYLIEGTSQPKVLREMLQVKLEEMRRIAEAHKKASTVQSTYSEVKSEELKTKKTPGVESRSA